METSARYRWQVRSAALLLFVTGFLAGILATNFYRARQAPAAGAGGRDRFEQVLDKLDLTPDQRTQVRAIFDDARAQLTELRRQSAPKFREVRRQTDDRLRAVLTAEQWGEFERLTGELRNRRPRGRDRGERRE